MVCFSNEMCSKQAISQMGVQTSYGWPLTIEIILFFISCLINCSFG